MADNLTGVTETLATAMDMIGSRAQEYLNQEAKFRPLLTNYSDLVIKGAKTVEIPRAGGFIVSQKAENTAADATAITWATDSIALNQHKYVQWLIEDISSEQSVMRVVEENVLRASKDMARDYDQFLINLLETASAAAPDHRIAYAGAAIAEGDILEGRRLLISQYLDPSELVLAVSPSSEKTMLGLSNFIDASKYGAGTPIANGEIGRVFGATVIVHNDVEDLKSLMFHRSAVGYADQFGVRFQSETDLANIGRRYSMDQLYGGSLLDSGKRCVMLGTAA